MKVVLFRLLSVGRKISASKNLCALGIDCALLTRMHHRMPVPQVEINKREKKGKKMEEEENMRDFLTFAARFDLEWLCEKRE